MPSSEQSGVRTGGESECLTGKVGEERGEKGGMRSVNFEGYHHCRLLVATCNQKNRSATSSGERGSPSVMSSPSCSQAVRDNIKEITALYCLKRAHVLSLQCCFLVVRKKE